MSILIGIVGIFAILGLCFMLSNNRKLVNFKAIAIMLGIQFGITWAMLNTEVGSNILKGIAAIFNKLISFGAKGIDFVVGGITPEDNFVFFINVLLVIVFFSALLSVLSYLKVLPFLIRWIGGAISKITGMPKIESFHAVNTSLLGDSTALVALKDQFRQMDKNRLLVVCISGLASISITIAGSYMALVPAQFVLVAIPLNLFSGLIIGSLVAPSRVSKEADKVIMDQVEPSQGIFEALGNGAIDGLKVAGIVAAMLIAFIGSMEMINYVVGAVSGLFGAKITLQEILGYVLYPFVLLMGIPANEALQAGGIIGTKTIMNEFVAMLQFKPMIPHLSAKTVAIVSSYLISFSNFSSIGIITGAVKAVNEKKAKEIAEMGLKILIGSTLASMLTATIVGLFV